MDLKEEFIKTIALLNKKDILLDNKFEINKSEFLVLLSISCSNEDICAKNLKMELGLSKSMITNLLTSLEEKGFLTRTFDLQDKRKCIIKITKKGNNFVKSATKNFDYKLDKLFREIKKEDIKKYIELTKKIMEVLDCENIK